MRVVEVLMGKRCFHFFLNMFKEAAYSGEVRSPVRVLLLCWHLSCVAITSKPIV
jgi:hypothetical protein